MKYLHTPVLGILLASFAAGTTGCSVTHDVHDMKTSAGRMAQHTAKIDTSLKQMSDTAAQQSKDQKASNELTKQKTDELITEVKRNSTADIVKAVTAVKEVIQQNQSGADSVAAQYIQQNMSPTARRQQLEEFKKAESLENSIAEGIKYVCMFEFRLLDSTTAPLYGIDFNTLRAENVTEYIMAMNSFADGKRVDQEVSLFNSPKDSISKFNILAALINYKSCSGKIKASSNSPGTKVATAPAAPSFQPSFLDLIAEEITAVKATLSVRTANMNDQTESRMGEFQALQGTIVIGALQAAHNAQMLQVIRAARTLAGKTDSYFPFHFINLIDSYFILPWQFDLRYAPEQEIATMQFRIDKAVHLEEILIKNFNQQPAYDSILLKLINWMKLPTYTALKGSKTEQLFNAIKTQYIVDPTTGPKP